MREELDAAVDIEKLEADVARIGKALENNGAARRMLSRQLDALDASDRSYERKYEDMQARLDKLYDESADIEEALDEAEAKLESAKEKQVTTARVYEMLDEFQEKFDTYDPAKQKEILQQVVERVEIDPDANPKKGDAIVKRVRFKCPVSFYRTLPEEAYDVLGINEFNRLETTEYTPDGNSRVDGNHDETVVLLSHKKPDSIINVKVEFGEGEGKVPLDNIRVTYKMIKEYIEAKYGFKVHTAYIAEVKRDLGLPMYDAPNVVEELKQPRKHPTAEKVEAIKDALKYFGII